MKSEIRSFNKVLGGYVALCRKGAKETQVALGGVVGLDQSAISRVERGSQELTARQLFKIVKHYDLFDKPMPGFGDCCKKVVAFRFVSR